MRGVELIAVVVALRVWYFGTVPGAAPSVVERGTNIATDIATTDGDCCKCRGNSAGTHPTSAIATTTITTGDGGGSGNNTSSTLTRSAASTSTSTRQTE